MNKQVELLQYLHKLTRSGKLRWSETAEEEVFQASFPRYSVQITETPTTMGGTAEGTDFVISIFNDQGKKVEEIKDWDESLKGLEPGAYYVMQETYIAARQQALGADEAYDHLISELRGLDLPF